MNEHIPAEGQSDRNRYQIGILTELGCSIEQGEYSIYIDKILHGAVGLEDFGLVADCIQNNLSAFELPPEGYTAFILQETGEREDVFWNKYYELAEKLGSQTDGN